MICGQWYNNGMHHKIKQNNTNIQKKKENYIQDPKEARNTDICQYQKDVGQIKYSHIKYLAL